ncbi:P-loop containing nucleoside triphosphate hydrolase protein [Umbelopsis sp. PMI_123]|nr:P-loop containing nucleoside triphosphate hydrolase protein [Umbelopsis sp. PMI_123]
MTKHDQSTLVDMNKHQQRQKHFADLIALLPQTIINVPSRQKQEDQPSSPTRTGGISNYYFENDKSLPSLNINLKPEIEIRPYQKEALDLIVKRSKDASHTYIQSGLVVLPCGAGKTLASILVACALKKSVLVVCSTVIAAEQFRREFLKFTTIIGASMGMFAGERKFPFNGRSGVLFATYSSLLESRYRTQDAKRLSQFMEDTKWGLCILDEVHCVPANQFSKAVKKIKAEAKIGLTATLLREDEKIGDLDEIIGPILYEAKWKELAEKGYIAKVICTQIELDMTPVFADAYANIAGGNTHHTKALLAILNPNKFRICEQLVRYHEGKGDKVLVYIDHIDALKFYAEAMNRPFIYGDTPADRTQHILDHFSIPSRREVTKLHWSDAAARQVDTRTPVNTLFLSRIGDTSLDLPEATVLIQISSHFGSRRQEAQRLGRILRARRRNETGFFSRFYTLVTSKTHEIAFSEKRRGFLESECGYDYAEWRVNGRIPDGGWDVETDYNISDRHVIDDEKHCEATLISTKPSDKFETKDEQMKHCAWVLGLKQNSEPEEDITSVSSIKPTKRKLSSSASHTPKRLKA